MNQGWIKLHRALLDKPIWLQSTPEQKTILITLLMMANHSEKQWEWQGEKFTARPGQFVTSIKSIIEKCGDGISTQNVRSALKRFEKFNFLTNQSTKQNRLIIIENWGIYQGRELEGNKDPNNQLTKPQQSSNNQLTTNKNERMKDNKYIYIDGDKKPIRVNYNSVQEYWEALRDWEIKNGALGIINISKPENEIKQNIKTKSLDEWYKENPMPLLQRFQDKKEFTEQFKSWTKRKNEFKEKMNE